MPERLNSYNVPDLPKNKVISSKSQSRFKAETSHSGLVRSLGKRVRNKILREFKSRRLRLESGERWQGRNSFKSSNLSPSAGIKLVAILLFQSYEFPFPT